MRKDLLIWGIIVLFIVILVSISACVVGALLPRPQIVPPTATPLAPIVNIEQIRQAAELSTVKYTLSTDVTSTRVPEDIRREFGVKEEIVLIAYGEVAAGFDLSRLQEGDLWSDGSRVQLHLPPPQILYVRLDNERTHVVYYQKSWFIDRDLGLESRTRQEAEEIIRQAALEGELLAQARRYGQLFFENWFYTMGFTEVKVIID